MKYYIIAFVPGETSDATVLFSPDFPEFSSQGYSVEECMSMAMESLESIIEDYIKEKRAIPEPCDMKTAKERINALLVELDGKVCDGIEYQYVPVFVPDTTTINVAISMKKSELEEIDFKAKLYGMKRSRFLVSAAKVFRS